MRILLRKAIIILKNERGDFGVKEIAMMVAGVVVVGLIVAFLTTNISTMLGTLWQKIVDWLN